MEANQLSHHARSFATEFVTNRKLRALATQRGPMARLRWPSGARDEFLLLAVAQNLKGWLRGGNHGEIRLILIAAL